MKKLLAIAALAVLFAAPAMAAPMCPGDTLASARAVTIAHGAPFVEVRGDKAVAIAKALGPNIAFPAGSTVAITPSPVPGDEERIIVGFFTPDGCLDAMGSLLATEVAAAFKAAGVQ